MIFKNLSTEQTFEAEFIRVPAVPTAKMFLKATAAPALTIGDILARTDDTTAPQFIATTTPYQDESGMWAVPIKTHLRPWPVPVKFVDDTGRLHKGTEIREAATAAEAERAVRAIIRTKFRGAVIELP